jgi:FtsH-binding integral membrane protein
MKSKSKPKATIKNALIGCVIGGLPAALWAVSDSSIMRSDSGLLVVFYFVGVLGVTLGSLAGYANQNAKKRGAQAGGILFGVLCGSVVGIVLAGFVQEGLSIPGRESYAACVGLLLGGVLGVLVGGREKAKTKNA